jgi:hypothetical protein
MDDLQRVLRRLERLEERVRDRAANADSERERQRQEGCAHGLKKAANVVRREMEGES